MNSRACHHHPRHPDASAPWRNKTVWALVGTGVLLAVSRTVDALEPLGHALSGYLGVIWWAMLLGLLIGGLIDRYVPSSYILHYLARPQKRTVFYSVFFGLLMSVCSHGILALAVELHKKGASTAAVIAFLLASPWANLPITILLIGFFQWKAFYFIGGALLVAVNTGLIFQLLEARGWVEQNPLRPETRPSDWIRNDVAGRLRRFRPTWPRLRDDARAVWRGSVSLADMVLWWVLAGAVLASVLGAYVPASFFKTYMGPNLPGLGATLVVATLLEVCSEGMAPLAFELYRQTGALGNAFVFLMAGVVTDYTEIGLVWINVGRRAALWLPLVSVPQVILLGWLANHLFFA